MGAKSEKAKELFLQGYNCSQAILGAFAEELGLDLETAMKLASSFGGGMGRLREVCGAVSGMFMVAGLKYGYTSPVDREGKTNHYKLIQQLAEDFTNKNGSIICRELLGLNVKKDNYIPSERTQEYYKTRPCLGKIEDAALILENLLYGENKENVLEK